MSKIQKGQFYKLEPAAEQKARGIKPQDGKLAFVGKVPVLVERLETGAMRIMEIGEEVLEALEPIAEKGAGLWEELQELFRTIPRQIEIENSENSKETYFLHIRFHEDNSEAAFYASLNGKIFDAVGVHQAPSKMRARGALRDKMKELGLM